MKRKRKHGQPTFSAQIAKLLNVKTIVTFAIVYVFVKLSLSGDISADVAMSVVTMVIAFYFGTQHTKKDEESPYWEEKPPDDAEERARVERKLS